MSMLSEGYIKRLQDLAGLDEAYTNAEKNASYGASAQRVPYSKDLMIQAIREGREVGILFQSNNEAYKMPVAKYRIIYPVALGISKKGNVVIRAFHKMGQSESEAINTGQRSAEVENTWRLMKVANIKGMWFTGIFFRGPLEAYNPDDKSMVNVEFAADFNKIRKFQDDMVNQAQGQAEREKKRKNIINLFKDTGERPLENPIKPIENQPIDKPEVIEPYKGRTKKIQKPK